MQGFGLRNIMQTCRTGRWVSLLCENLTFGHWNLRRGSLIPFFVNFCQFWASRAPYVVLGTHAAPLEILASRDL